MHVLDLWKNVSLKVLGIGSCSNLHLNIAKIMKGNGKLCVPQFIPLASYALKLVDGIFFFIPREVR